MGTIGVALSVLVMLVSVFIIDGFKGKINETISDFSGGYSIENIVSQQYVSWPRMQPTLKRLNKKPDLNFHTTALVKSKTGIKSVLVVGKPSSWLKKNIQANDSILTSLYTSKKLWESLDLDKNQETNLLLGEALKSRKVKIESGFNTYIEKIDDKVIYCDISLLQSILKPGLKIKASILKDSVLITGNNKFRIVSDSSKQSYYTKKAIIPINETPLRLIDENDIELIFSPKKSLKADNHSNYLTSVSLNDLSLNEIDEIQKSLPVNYHLINNRSRFPQLYNWLSLLDTNIVVILGLVLLIAVANICSLGLVLALEKTEHIAILKAIGMEEKNIKRIFLVANSRIILNGLLIGNILALLFAFIQWKFELISLNPEDYFMEYVPVKISLWSFILVNLLSIFVPIILSKIPLRIIAKMNPASILRLN